NITWGGSTGDSGNGITVDGAGNIYITGYTNLWVMGDENAFIAKYDSAGTSLLNITWVGSNGDSGNGIALDGAGNIYITGCTNMYGAGGPDAFIAKYDSAGTSLLNITWGGSNGDSGNDIALDGSGNIYITGYTASFGAGYSDAFIAKYKRIIDDSTDAGIPGPTILLIGIISALSIGMILKRLLQTNKLRRI
ncbi:MAG: SBBP repeat-containing protein, partial [Promethearchaeota archaeon]